MSETPVENGEGTQSCHASGSRWGWLHWVLCLTPLAFLLAIPLLDLARYAWVPLAATLACPLGMGAMMWRMRNMEAS